MRPPRYLELISADGLLLRAAAARDLTAAVPACPAWRAADLVRHVAAVYLHKVEAMRSGVRPDPWPPAGLDERDPLELFDEALSAVLAELTSRGTTAPSWTFWPDDQTSGFWFRRMAHETAVHRVDAEQATGLAAPVDAELALDGVDEMLRVMLGGPWWTDDTTREAAGTTLLVRAGDRAWTVRIDRNAVTVTDTPDPAGARSDVTVEGEPSDVDLWLWGRVPDDAVSITGDVGAVRALLSEQAG